MKRPRWIAALSAGGLMAVMGLAMAQDQISPPPGYFPPPPPPSGVGPPPASDGTRSLGVLPVDPNGAPSPNVTPALRGSSADQSPMDIGISPPPGEPTDETASPDETTEGVSPEGMTIEPLEPVDGAGEETAAPDEATSDQIGVQGALDQPGAREAAMPGGMVAVLRGLDKITARVTVVNAPIGKPVTFGKLKIVADYCYKRPPEETPEVTAFVQIDDTREKDPAKARIFSGWMFESSPALHAVEHPVYDVWLIDCKAATPESDFGGLPKAPTAKELDSKHER